VLEGVTWYRQSAFRFAGGERTVYIGSPRDAERCREPAAPVPVRILTPENPYERE
jgi:hypothetical protein